MRRALAVKMGLAVILWFFTAPFFHLHAADTEGHHHHQEVSHDQDAIVHFHLPAFRGAGDGAAFSPAGEDEKPLDSFAIAQKHILVRVLLLVPSARVEMRQPALTFVQRMAAPRTPRAHDPPELRATTPRAPPF